MEPLKKFEWRCPHLACTEVITAYTDSGLHTLKCFHEDSHRRAREYALGPEAPPEPKDLNKLILTVADKAFLKTRGIKAD